jgi:tol-pal system protein YbgF
MKILLSIICLLFAVTTYAEDDIIMTTLDSPLAVSAPHTETEDDRLSACESKIQNLINRVEILEHEFKTLSSQNPQIVTTPPLSDDEKKNPKLETNLDQTNPSTTSGNEKIAYDKALAALKESRFEDAEAMFVAFMQQYPNSELSGNAHFWYGESFYRRGDFDKAAVIYLKGYKKFPKAQKAADSLLKLALSLGELKKNKDACLILDKLEAEYKHRPASSIKRASDAKVKYGCK